MTLSPTPTLSASRPSRAAPTSSPSASWIRGGSGLSDASAAVTTFGADTLPLAVPPVLSDVVGTCHARIASGRGGRTAAQSSTRTRATSLALLVPSPGQGGADETGWLVLVVTDLARDLAKAAAVEAATGRLGAWEDLHPDTPL